MEHNKQVKLIIAFVVLFVALLLATMIVVSIPAAQVLIKMEDTSKSDLTIKITGHQWKWSYEYIDTGSLRLEGGQASNVEVEDATLQDRVDTLEVDNMLVVPSGRKVRVLLTASDVIHAWWVPAFGVKKDAIPGYINELWFNVNEGEEAIYRGQCAELCGKGHGKSCERR